MTMKINHIASSSAGNAHVVDGRILLDAGVSARQIRREIMLTDLEAAFITHEHGDHSAALEDILRAGVEVYTSPGTAKALGVNSHHRIHKVRDGDRFNVGNYRVIAVEAFHDAEEPLGFVVIGSDFKLLYLTDTSYSKYTFKGITHYLVECNYSRELATKSVNEGRIPEWQKRRLLETHFGLSEVVDFLHANDLSVADEIHLLHLSDSNADAKLFKQKIERETGVPVVVAGK